MKKSKTVYRLDDENLINCQNLRNSIRGNNQNVEIKKKNIIEIINHEEINVKNNISNLTNKDNNKSQKIDNLDNKLSVKNNLSNCNSVSKSNISYIEMFNKNINIFDAIILFLTQNFYVRQYFSKNKEDLKYWYERKNQSNLISILYRITKYFMRININGVIMSHKTLVEMYNYLFKKFLEFKLCSNDHNSLYDVKNLDTIIEFIYSKINQEITYEKKLDSIPKFNVDSGLATFMHDFMNNNRSFISDNFIGFNKIIHRNYNNYIAKEKYESFSFISFDINKCILPINNNSQNEKQINLYDCFNHKFAITMNDSHQLYNYEPTQMVEKKIY